MDGRMDEWMEGLKNLMEEFIDQIARIVACSPQ